MQQHLIFLCYMWLVPCELRVAQTTSTSHSPVCSSFVQTLHSVFPLFLSSSTELQAGQGRCWAPSCACRPPCWTRFPPSSMSCCRCSRCRRWRSLCGAPWAACPARCTSASPWTWSSSSPSPARSTAASSPSQVSGAQPAAPQGTNTLGWFCNTAFAVALVQIIPYWMPVMLVIISLGSIVDKCIHSLSWSRVLIKPTLWGWSLFLQGLSLQVVYSMILVCPSSEYSVTLLTLFNTNTLQVSLW